MKVIFVVGAGHSGSTLLDILLNRYPVVFGAGELATLYTHNKSEENNQFWKSILEGLPETDLEVYRSKIDLVRGVPTFRHASTGAIVDTKSYIEFHEKLYGRILEKTHTEVVVDTSKDIQRVEILSKSTVIEPIVVHLVRDGRGVTWSYVKKQGMYSIFPYSKWGLENIKIELVRARVPSVPYVRISYAELVHAPGVVCERILHTAHLPDETISDEVLQEKKIYRGVGGNRMKHTFTNSISEDVSWRTHMPFVARGVFALLFGWLNWYYRRHIRV